jgi:hypothetical protein
MQSVAAAFLGTQKKLARRRKKHEDFWQYRQAGGNPGKDHIRMHRNRNPNKVSLFPLLPPVIKHEQTQIFYLRVIRDSCLLWNTKETRTKAQKTRRFLDGMYLPNPKKLQQGTGYLYFESQRDSGTQPGVGRRPPWVTDKTPIQPQRGA